MTPTYVKTPKATTTHTFVVGSETGMAGRGLCGMNIRQRGLVNGRVGWPWLVKVWVLGYKPKRTCCMMYNEFQHGTMMCMIHNTMSTSKVFLEK
jgi:hypothetical protein